MQALKFYHQVTCDLLQADAAELTARQSAILLTIYLDSNNRRVKTLARQLQISKPAISRALDRLEQLELVKRRADDQDGRSVIIHRTLRGTWFLTKFADIIIARIADASASYLEARTAQESEFANKIAP